MALLAGVVADRLNSSQDNDGWESDLSEESSPSSLLYMYFMQAETRKMYKTLLDEDDDFPGFHVGLG